MTKPIISIITPCYNNSDTIIETLESIKNQVFKDFELIIINDGSSDNSAEIITNYISKNKNLNIYLYSTANNGPSKSRNLGSSYAKGTYIMFLDADDKIESTYISKCISYLENNTSMNLVYSEAEFFEAKKGKWDLKEFEMPNFLIDNCIPIFCVIRINVFEKVGKFDENLNYTEDWELWIRIIKEFGGVYRIPEVLFYYRKRKSKNSLTDTENKDDISEKSRLYIYNKHYEFYKKNNLGLVTLITSVENNNYYKQKYFNIWYKKLFYKFKNKNEIN